MYTRILRCRKKRLHPFPRYSRKEYISILCTSLLPLATQWLFAGQITILNAITASHLAQKLKTKHSYTSPPRLCLRDTLYSEICSTFIYFPGFKFLDISSCCTCLRAVHTAIQVLQHTCTTINSYIKP